MAKITIFGLAGTGTTTAAKEVCKILNYDFIYAGGIFREKAKSLGLDLYQFEQLVSRDPSYDRELDADMAKYGREHDNFIADGWLAWYFIPDSFKIKLTCGQETRLKRIVKRDGVSYEEAKAKTEFRESEHLIRYKEVYGIDNYYIDDRYFDLVIDTTDNPPERVAEQIIVHLKDRQVAC